MIQDVRKLIDGGRLHDAERLLSQILKDSPRETAALTLLGMTYIKSQKLSEAEECLTRALENDPDDLEALSWMAVVRKSQSRRSESLEYLDRVLTVQPNNPEIVNLRGICLLEEGRAAEAEAAFRLVFQFQGESAPAYANLGMALRLQNRGPEALTAFKRAVELDPRKPANHLQVFKQLQQMSLWDEAIRCLHTGLKVHPESLSLLEALAVSYARRNRQDEAEQIFERIFPASAEVANSYATCLQETGRFQDSIKISLDSLRQRPIQGAAYRQLVEAGCQEIGGRPILDAMLSVETDRGLDRNGRMHLAYAIAMFLQTAGEFERSMRYFHLANDLAYQIYPAPKTFDRLSVESEPAQVAKLFALDSLSALAKLGSSDSRPIFIVGMIRSGTTLLDQILSAHPQVASNGEPAFWNSRDHTHRDLILKGASSSDLEAIALEYLSSLSIPEGQERFTDKMPLNYRHLGWIHSTFPNAKMIHVKRDPFDTCLSIYTTFFAGGPMFAYRQENIVTFYRAYLKFMEHWRTVLPPDLFLEIDYESIVNQPELKIPQIIEFLGLPWDERCLHHEQNPGQVSTPSRWQARQPIYRTSIGKREVYGKYVSALQELL